MKILYLSYLTDADTFDKVFAGGLEPSVARQKFEITFIESLLGNPDTKSEDINIVSFVPYNENVLERVSESEIKGKKINYIWWSRGIKSFITAVCNVQKVVRDWYRETNGEKRVILTYATNPLLLLTVLTKRCTLVTICSEVPRFRVMGDSWRAKLKKEYYHFLNERMDGYIFFSKHMEEVCNFRNKPFMVIEGMPSISDEKTLNHLVENKKEQIFYAGGLNSENGIVELLHAFVKIERKDVSLVLCGVGNVVDMVEKFADGYTNIKYLGSLPNEEILQLEKQSTLLINPRKVDERMTRYSFPSKTLEYFCSGTACMMTRLEGIPNEYYNYCYECDSSSADTLAKDLEKVLSIPQQERNKKAKEAYDFILREKTSEKQTEKIIDFLHNMCSVHKG